MTIAVPEELFNIERILDKLTAYAIPNMNFWNLAEIAIIAQTTEDAMLVADRLRSKISHKFNLVCYTQKEVNILDKIRGRTRGMVIMAERLLLGTEIIDALEISLAHICAMCDDGYSPMPRDLFVDLDGNPFLKK